MASNGKLAGQIALVTGASRGIGRAIVNRLAEEGADVVLLARNPEGVENAALALRESFPGRRFLRGQPVAVAPTPGCPEAFWYRKAGPSAGH